jgi:hypothetical protein
LQRSHSQKPPPSLGEIQRSIDYYLATSAEGEISRIYLSGGTSKIGALATAIETRSRLPVEQLDLCLYGKNHGISVEEVARAADLAPEAVRRVLVKPLTKIVDSLL